MSIILPFTMIVNDLDTSTRPRLPLDTWEKDLLAPPSSSSSPESEQTYSFVFANNNSISLPKDEEEEETKSLEPQDEEEEGKRLRFDLESVKTFTGEIDYDINKEDLWWNEDEIRAIFAGIRKKRPGESRRGLELFQSRNVMLTRNRAKKASIKAVIETQERYKGTKTAYEAIRLAYVPHTLVALDRALLAAIDDEDDAR